MDLQQLELLLSNTPRPDFDSSPFFQSMSDSTLVLASKNAPEVTAVTDSDTIMSDATQTYPISSRRKRKRGKGEPTNEKKKQTTSAKDKPKNVPTPQPSVSILPPDRSAILPSPPSTSPSPPANVA